MIVVGIVLVALVTWTLRRALVLVPPSHHAKRPVAALRSGDVLLFASTSWLDDVLKLASGCEYTGVGVVVVDAQGKAFVFEGQSPGAAFTRVSKRLHQAKQEGVVCITRRLTPSIPAKQLAGVTRSLMGTPHSARGVIWGALGLGGTSLSTSSLGVTSSSSRNSSSIGSHRNSSSLGSLRNSNSLGVRSQSADHAGKREDGVDRTLSLYCSELAALVYARTHVLRFTLNWRHGSDAFISPQNFTELHQDLPMSSSYAFGPECILSPS